MYGEKPKLIIFTGVDATGKSTIVEYISNKLNIPTKHMDKVKNEEEGKKLNYAILNNTNDDLIMDRYYMEECVYAIVYRNYEAKYIQELENLLLTKFNVVIVCTFAETEVIEERFDSRGESSTKKENIPELKKLYDDFLQNSLIKKKILIDTTNNLIEKDYNDIIRLLENILSKEIN